MYNFRSCATRFGCSTVLFLNEGEISLDLTIYFNLHGYEFCAHIQLFSSALKTVPSGKYC